MRIQALLIICIACMLNAGSAVSQNGNQAQNKDKLSYIYMGLGGGPAFEGYNFGLSGSLTFSNNWGCVVKYNTNRVTAKKLPNDYIERLCFFNNCIPKDNFNSVSISLLREFDSRYESVRFGLEAGPAIGIYQQATFRKKSSGGGWFGSNYTTSYIETTALGLHLRARGAFYLASFTGIELAISTTINQYQSYIGADVFIIFGKVKARNGSGNNW